MADPELGQVDNANEPIKQLHRGAVSGSKRFVKRSLERGADIESVNDQGQTALFCACFKGHEGVVELLLQFGANPNHRAHDGSTPVHAACYYGNIRILEKVLDKGGDLRLHDNSNDLPRDWAFHISDQKRRKKMLEYIEKTRLFAMQCSNNEQNIYATPRKSATSNRVTNAVLEFLLAHHWQPNENNNITSMGFGKVLKEQQAIGSLASLPLIQENELSHNDYGPTYNNGPYMVMESMHWNFSPVTIKRLHRDPLNGGIVDLLISENENIAKLRHPNIILLMGICPTNNLDSLVLVYEPVIIGSVYHYLHERFETISKSDANNIAKQLSEAIVFLHSRSIIHCFITSHSVQLVTPTIAKLGNFEYAVEQTGTNLKFSSVLENRYCNAAYNWMAPEVMNGEPPTDKSDLFSFCVVLWEMLQGEIPWSGKSAAEISEIVLEQSYSLPINEDNIPVPYNALLERGLELQPEKRNVSFSNMRDILANCKTERDLKSLDLSRQHSLHRHNVSYRSQNTSYRNRYNLYNEPRISNYSYHDQVPSAEDDAAFMTQSDEEEEQAVGGTSSIQTTIPVAESTPENRQRFDHRKTETTRVPVQRFISVDDHEIQSKTQKLKFASKVSNEKMNGHCISIPEEKPERTTPKLSVPRIEVGLSPESMSREMQFSFIKDKAKREYFIKMAKEMEIPTGYKEGSHGVDIFRSSVQLEHKSPRERFGRSPRASDVDATQNDLNTSRHSRNSQGDRSISPRRSSYSSIPGVKPASHQNHHEPAIKSPPNLGIIGTVSPHVSPSSSFIEQEVPRQPEPPIRHHEKYQRKRRSWMDYDDYARYGVKDQEVTSRKYRSEVHMHLISNDSKDTHQAPQHEVKQDSSPESDPPPRPPPPPEWYAGLGSVRNLVSAFEGPDEKGVFTTNPYTRLKYQHPVCSHANNGTKRLSWRQEKRHSNTGTSLSKPQSVTLPVTTDRPRRLAMDILCSDIRPKSRSHTQTKTIHEDYRKHMSDGDLALPYSERNGDVEIRRFEQTAGDEPALRKPDQIEIKITASESHVEKETYDGSATELNSTIQSNLQSFNRQSSNSPRKNLEVTFSGIVTEKKISDHGERPTFKKQESNEDNTAVESESGEEEESQDDDDELEEVEEEEIEEEEEEDEEDEACEEEEGEFYHEERKGKKKRDDIEEFYFDDVINDQLAHEKHMRLQATLPLDTPRTQQENIDYINQYTLSDENYEEGIGCSELNGDLFNGDSLESGDPCVAVDEKGKIKVIAESNCQTRIKTSLSEDGCQNVEITKLNHSTGELTEHFAKVNGSPISTQMVFS